MSAAAARRRKQLAARKQKEAEVATAAAANNSSSSSTTGVMVKLNELLNQKDDLSEESVAYEALQLAQSVVRKDVSNGEYGKATELAYLASKTILTQGRVSVASQLLTLLVDVFKETHTEETQDWITKLEELNQAHGKAMMTTITSSITDVEVIRLYRLQRDWLRRCIQWSAELGTIKLGNPTLHAMLGQECWTLAQQLLSKNTTNMDKDTKEDIMDLQCDAVVHLALAEQPQGIMDYLKDLPQPTKEQTKTGHTCAPALRDALFTRSILCFIAMENLRDANILCQAYMKTEERSIPDLTKSYVNKEDGMSPSHVIFATSLLRVCEKDIRTGPLFSWLLRSFKRELEKLHKPNVVSGYTTKIGKIYFNIQPPPSMLNMMENMMSMMGGGGGGAPGLNPAMMQAAMAQMQQGGMM